MIRLVLILALMVPITAHAGVLHWGNEVSACGSNHFETKIGNGQPIYVTRIQGAVTATPQEGDGRWWRWRDLTRKSNKQLQSLVVLHHDGQVQATTSATDGKTQNNQVDQGLFAVNPKTFGMNPVVVPIDYAFDPPVLVPNGVLRLRVDVAGPGPMTIDRYECLNTETHMTIQWRDRP